MNPERTLSEASLQLVSSEFEDSLGLVDKVILLLTRIDFFILVTRKYLLDIHKRYLQASAYCRKTLLQL